MARWWALAAAILVLLAGCTEGAEPPEGHWVLRGMSYDDTSYDDFLASFTDHAVTLLVDEQGTITGTGACNGYGTTPSTGGRFPVADVHHTMMSCGALLDAFDRQYFDALKKVTDVEQDGEDLVLTGEDLRMEFEARG